MDPLLCGQFMKVLVLLSQLLLVFVQIRDTNPWTITPDGKSELLRDNSVSVGERLARERLLFVLSPISDAAAEIGREDMPFNL